MIHVPSRLAASLAGGALLSLLLVVVPSTAGAAPSGEPAYADGQTYWMHSAHLIAGASGGLLSAPPIYILGFAAPTGSSGPITLPSGYEPQCDPCLQEPVAYHDHLLTGEPGSGTSGTAGDYRSPWRVVIMLYNPGYADSPGFVPVTSDDQLSEAEFNHDFVPINPGAPDPYEIWTGNVLICPLVQAG